MRYYVRYRPSQGGPERYGTVDEFSQEAKEAAARGLVKVDDLIQPWYDEVPESGLVDVDFDEVWQVQQAEFEKARELADRLDGVKVGAMFQLPVGDGFAAYVVTKVNRKTCDVEWRGYCADRWYDHHFGIGGRFPIEEIEPYVARTQGLARLFGGAR